MYLFSEQLINTGCTKLEFNLFKLFMPKRRHIFFFTLDTDPKNETNVVNHKL